MRIGLGRGVFLIPLIVAGAASAGAQGGAKQEQAAAEAPAKAGPGIVFQPGMQFLPAVHEQCNDLASDKLQDCFAEQMKKAGASVAAAEFSRQLGEPGFARDFRAVGPVDVAYVLYPYRANENQACLLVNGNPADIDIDNQKLLDLDGAQRDRVYAGLAKRYRELTVWPGERGGTDYPEARKTTDGGVTFTAAYRLRNRCHACAIVGTAWFSFQFDKAGKLGTTSFAGATEAAGGMLARNPKRAITVTAGREITIELKSNRTTGYSWALAEPLAGHTLRLIEHAYAHPRGAPGGAGGVEFWKFGALKTGSADLTFVYRRAREKDPAPAQTETFHIIVGSARAGR
jgi:predicted secreted protein